MISRRECRAFLARPVFWFLLMAPPVCTLFFTTLMQAGLPTALPAAIVNEDNTATSRKLRHYYLIYVNQALDGFPLREVWPSVCWLVAFCLSPLLVGYRYRKAFLKFEYLP